MPDDEGDRSAAGPLRAERDTSRRGFLAGVAGAAVSAHGVPGVAAAAVGPDKGDGGVNPRLFTFVGGKAGGLRVVQSKAVVGEPLPGAERLEIVNAAAPRSPALPDGAAWVLRGVTSNERYVTRPEKDQLAAKQAAIFTRPGATRAALIPIRKSAKWWAMTQDERRAVFEERSKHLTLALKYVPAVARRLHHCRDLGEGEPFDFLTLFDYAEADAAAFEDLVAALRATEEWKFVDREADIRLVRAAD